MATEQATMGLNGNYASNQPQTNGVMDASYNSLPTVNTFSTGADYNNTAAPPSSTSNGGGSTEIPKDEVGWYFVEQYYTTLSRSPEKLYLFYNKKSQFVSGTETEKITVCVGQRAINDRIKELEFQECKVRVTNVDTQGSGSNIVIQVIGEISNKSAPQRKFTQTFVLAEQQNGYFVLNDIFRYILEEEEVEGEEELQHGHVEAASGYQEPIDASEEVVAHSLTSSNDAAEQAHDVELLDRGLAQAIKQETETVEAEQATPTLAEDNASPEKPAADAEPENDAPFAHSTSAIDETVSEPEVAEQIRSVEATEPEKSKDPEPAPPISPAKLAPTSLPTPAVAPTAVSKSSAPKTWANLVAGNRIAAPAAPTPTAPPSTPSPAAVKAMPPVPVQAPVSVTPAIPTAPSVAAGELEQADNNQSSGSEWQTAGHDHGKKQARPQATQALAENSRGYIKNVNENTDGQLLRSVLSKIGEVTYLDINRQKNCAFVDFLTPAGYQAVVAANPHDIGGERVYVEERRIRPPGSAPGYGSRGGSAMRGGRGGFDTRTAQGRGGFQKEGGRGGFAPRGRGATGARGRAGSQQPV